jgi:HD-GYP domain-containing protein (c-di-GMP phosphodiesterase class II)
VKNILFINYDKSQLYNFREVLKKNGFTGIRLILCKNVQDVGSIIKDNNVNCIFYEIVDSNYLKDIKFLKIVALDRPRIICGSRLGKLELLNFINSGAIFYYLEKPLNEFNLTNALKSALSFNEEVNKRYIDVHKKYIQHQIEDLNNVGIALSNEHDLESLLEKIVSQALSLAHCDGGSLYILEGRVLSFRVARNNTLKKRYGEGYEEKCFKRYKIPVNQDRISGRVALTGETLNIADVYSLPDESGFSFTDDFDKRNKYVTRSMINAPLKDKDDNVLGVLQLINCLDTEGNVIPFSKDIEGLIQSLASQAAIAIGNARLIKKVNDTHLDTILRLSMTAEFRDSDTSDHLQRMSNYSLIIGEKLGLDKNDLEILKYASPMHDIGKVGIPDSILFKPGTLDENEWIEMKNHSVYGAQILEGSDSPILKASSQIALSHHEKWNGDGYPGGIKKDNIPLFGQIVSIVDVFDALTSKRCYKKAYDLDYSIDEIKASKDINFSPLMVDVFMDSMDKIVKVYKDSKKRIEGGEYLHKGHKVEANIR